MESKNSQRMISEAIRKIALGRSIERVSMSQSGTGGVGTARMIHGYVRYMKMENCAERLTCVSFPMRLPAVNRLLTKGCCLPE